MPLEFCVSQILQHHLNPNINDTNVKLSNVDTAFAYWLHDCNKIYHLDISFFMYLICLPVEEGASE